MTAILASFAFSYIDYLFASQQGTLREYNPLTDNREIVGTYPREELLHEHTSASPDFFSDDSLQKFLDDAHPFSASYAPEDVVPIDSHFTFNASSKFHLRSEAALQFADMARAFSHAFDFQQKLSITSARRSSVFQKHLSSSCSTSRCALPGTSEHEAGLALDLGVNGGNILGGGGKYYARLRDNAHLYGFHNTYQKGIDTDGKIVEPRHRRYLGVELATHLHENALTFAEYFYTLYPTHDQTS